MNSLKWAIINFVIFFAALTWLLYRPILKLLDARRDEIKGNLDRAEAARKEAEEAKAEYERRAAKAKEEAQELLARAQATAEKTKDELLAQAQRQAADTIERAQKAIASEKERAIAEIRQEVADLAVMAAGKIIERSLNVEDHRQLVNDLVKKVPDAEGSRAGNAS